MYQTKNYLILGIAVLLLFASCSSPTSGSGSSSISDDDSSSTNTIAESEDLFVSDGSGQTFATNIFEYGSGNGATYWTEILPASDTFTTVNVEMSKISGYKLGGFGVFFSHSDADSNDFSALTVLLNMNGEYCIGLIEDSAFSYIKEWTSNSYIIASYNVANRVCITEQSAGRYSIAVNGETIDEFEDDSDPVHDGGGYGYIAVVSPLENFPSEAVEVYFETIP